MHPASTDERPKVMQLCKVVTKRGSSIDYQYFLALKCLGKVHGFHSYSQQK